MVNLDRCNGRFNALNIPSDKISVSNETRCKFKRFQFDNKNKNESKTLTKRYILRM